MKYLTQERLGALREAWINFNLPGLPLNVNVGHQLLQLGNGWFLRNMKYGDDAWVVANVTGANTVAFVDIKAAEGSTAQADDIDGYALLDVFKLSVTMTAGIDLTSVNDRRATLVGAPAGASLNLQNIGLNFNGAFGMLNLKAEVDFQMGKVENISPFTDSKFKGNQIVIQGNVALDPVTVNFTAARGSGKESTDTDQKEMVNILDADQHYTFLYEYKMATAAGATHTGFSNTTALSVGGSIAASKSVTVGLDLWYLRATEEYVSPVDGKNSDKIGTEIDAKLNWKLYDNLTWNWRFGWVKPGDAYKHGTVDAEDSTAVYGMLSFKF